MSRGNTHIGMLTRIDSGVDKVFDLFPDDIKFGWATRSLKSSYDNGKAMTIIRDSDDATLDIYFISGELDVASIGMFCGTAKGWVVAVYNHDDGTECRYGLSPNDYTYGYTYLGEIYDGTNVHTNEDGEYCIDFGLNVNSRLYMSDYSNTETWSTFLLTTRVATYVCTYNYGSNQTNLIADARYSGSFTHQQMDIAPLDISVNGVSIGAQTCGNYNTNLPYNNPLIVSQMRYSQNTTWTGNVIGGFNLYGRTFKGKVCGEIFYYGDKTSEEVDIITNLITQFNIT